MGIDVDALHEPDQNVLAGARYLAKMYKEFGGSWPRAVSAYNTGPINLQFALDQGHKWAPVTDDYVRAVMELLDPDQQVLGRRRTP